MNQDKVTALQILRSLYYAKIDTELQKLQSRLMTELKNDIHSVMGHELYAGPSGELNFSVEMFITNQIIDIALSNDPSGDWDGSPRGENIEDYNNNDYYDCGKDYFILKMNPIYMSKNISDEYPSFSSSELMKFQSDKEAEQYCLENTTDEVPLRWTRRIEEE